MVCIISENDALADVSRLEETRTQILQTDFMSSLVRILKVRSPSEFHLLLSTLVLYGASPLQG